MENLEDFDFNVSIIHRDVSKQPKYFIAWVYEEIWVDHPILDLSLVLRRENPFKIIWCLHRKAAQPKTAVHDRTWSTFKWRDGSVLNSLIILKGRHFSRWD